MYQNDIFEKLEQVLFENFNMSKSTCQMYSKCLVDMKNIEFVIKAINHLGDSYNSGEGYKRVPTVKQIKDYYYKMASDFYGTNRDKCPLCNGVGAIEAIYDYKTKKILTNDTAPFPSDDLFAVGMQCKCKNVFQYKNVEPYETRKNNADKYYFEKYKASDFIEKCKNLLNNKQGELECPKAVETELQNTNNTETILTTYLDEIKNENNDEKTETDEMYIDLKNVIAIDFETYYDSSYSVADMGNYAYTHDSRFDAYLIASYDGINSIVEHPLEFNWNVLNSKTVVAHNVSFDKSVYDRLREMGIVPKNVIVKNWICTADMCAYLQYPRSLKGACKEVLNIEVDKSVRENMRGFSESLFPDEVKKYASKDAILCYQLFERLYRKIPKLELNLSHITRNMGTKGISINTKYIDEHLKRLSIEENNILGKIPFRPATSLKNFQSFCENEGIEIPEKTGPNSPEFKNWLEKYGDSKSVNVLNNICEARTIHRDIKTIESLKNRVDSNGIFHYDLKYCGAITGRWSGSGGFNMQNLNREGKNGFDIRNCFVPKKGKHFAILDYSQIESRILSFVADDTDMLELLRDNPDMDIYEAHARSTMGYNDKLPLKDVDPKLRQLAKARVLGLGYGCGKDKFRIVAKTMADIDLTESESEDTVKSYRRSNSKIVSLWYILEQKFKKCKQKDFFLKTPMGRKINYRNIDTTLMTFNNGDGANDIYGGLITENLIQGIGRDILALAWLECVKNGYSPLISCHDELVFEVSDINEAKNIQAIMNKPTNDCWIKQIPLQTSLELCDHYKK